jgi:tetratricopeptide (TPR) repeat protein
VMRPLLGMLLFGALACGAGPRAPTTPTTPAGSASGQGGATSAAPGTADPEAAPTPSDRDRDQPLPRGSRQPVDLGTIKSDVVGSTPGGEAELETYSDATLLADGNDAMMKGEVAVARGHYQKLLSEIPDSALAPLAMFNLALLHERLAEWDQAIATYRDLVARYRTGRDVVDAAMRVGAVLTERKRYAEAERALDEVLARHDLTHADRIEALARKGYVLLEQGEPARSEAALRGAIAAYTKVSRLDDPYYIAMAHYYLGELPHRQFLAAPMRPPLDRLKLDVEAKAALATVAYDHFREALDFQQPYWSTAAGYQMSHIYKELWDAAVTAPVPPEVPEAGRAHYREEVHRLVFRYLEKALAGHQKNVELAAAFETPTAWSEASRQRATELARLLSSESAGVLTEPAATASNVRPAGAPATPYAPRRVDL